MGNIFDTVKALRDLGYSVVPSKGKHPSVKWKPYQDRLPTDAEHTAWRYDLKPKPELYGIVTGALSKIVVVDCDSADAMSIMGELLPHVRTPRGGGHYYFEHPGHYVKTVAGLLPKLDIRADGGFVNAVGTNPQTDGEYQIEIIPTPETIYPWAQMPKAILEEMNRSEPTSEAKPGEPISEGRRNSTLAEIAGAMRRHGAGQEAIEVALLKENATRCQPPLDEREVRRIAESVARYEPASILQSEAPEVISARGLMEKDFDELRFALPGMVPEGFTILAGKPKSGKSWWALQAAYSVALGKNLMDGSECEKGHALVLALEDGQRRLQDRIRKLNASDFVLQSLVESEKGIHIIATMGDLEVPDGLDLTVSWPKVGDGGIEELEKYLDEHPDTRLIIIDIIRRIAKKKGKGTAYDEDYESVQPLQELATRRRVAIIGVHHTRKASSDDPMDTVSGTFGLTGGADSVLVLKRESEDDFRFSITGRDIWDRELAIRFRKDCTWRLLGDASSVFISEEREEILDAIGEGSLAPFEIAKLINKNPSTTRTLLAKMLHAGLVSKDSSGKYSEAR